MAEYGWRLVAAAVVLIGVFGATALCIGLLSGPWWPSLIFQASRQPRIFGIWLAGSLAALVTAGTVLAAEAGLAFALLVWVICIPRIVGPLASRTIWKRDLKDSTTLVTEALAVRNRIRRANGDAEIAAGQFWPQYVLDQARAQMQARYKPPGEIERQPGIQA